MRVASGADQLYRLAQSRVGGDAVQVLELEGSHAEGGGDRGGEGLVGALEEGLHARVEGDLPAEDAKEEGGGEVAVGLGEGGHAGAVEEVVGVGGGLGDAEKDGEGGGAGGADRGVRGGLGLCRTLRQRVLMCRVLHRWIASTRVRVGWFWHVGKGEAVENVVSILLIVLLWLDGSFQMLYMKKIMYLIENNTKLKLFEIFVRMKLEVSGEL
jgi:hypothetical protein